MSPFPFFLKCLDGLAFWGSPMGDAFGFPTYIPKDACSLVDSRCVYRKFYSESSTTPVSSVSLRSVLIVISLAEYPSSLV